MFNRRRTVVFVVFVLFMFLFITFAGGTPQNQAIATRLVRFIDGYSENAVSEQTVIVGEDAIVPEDPVHDGYVFTGWYLESDRTVRVTDFTSITNDLTVVAGYGADVNRNGIVDDNDQRYTVTFMDSINNTTLGTQEVLTGMSATAPVAPTYAGQTFVGWSADYTNVTANMTVNTVYRADAPADDGADAPVVVPEIARYQVTFVDGDTLEVISTALVEEGLTATLPVAPIHENRVFHHWEGNYADVRSDETVTAIYRDDINHNQIADDEEERYAVVYYKGLNEVEGETPEDENTYLEGLTYTVLDQNTLELKDAVFLGWATRENNPGHVVTTEEEANSLTLVQPGDELVMGDRHVTYYAVWAENKNSNVNDTPDYLETPNKVTYNNGMNEEGEVVEEYLEGVTYTTIQNPFTREKAVFLGWATEQVALVTTKSDADQLNLIAENLDVVMTSEDVTYYAVWAIDGVGEEGKPDYEEVFKTTIEVVGGISNPTEKDMKYDETTTFGLTVSEGYTKDRAEVVCENATGIFSNDKDTLTVSNVTNPAKCVVTFKEDHVGGGEDGTKPDGIADENQIKITFKVKDTYNGEFLYTNQKYVVKGTENVVYENVTDKDYYVYNKSIVGVPTNAATYDNGTFTVRVKTYTEDKEIEASLNRKMFDLYIYNVVDGVETPAVSNGGRRQFIADSKQIKVNLTIPEKMIPQSATCDNGAVPTITSFKSTTGKYYYYLELKNFVAENKCRVSYTADSNDNHIPDEEETYQLTVQYQYEDGTKASEDHIENVVYNMPYRVTSPVIPNYTADNTVVEGTMGKEDQTITVTYRSNLYTVTFIGMQGEIVKTISDVKAGTILSSIKPDDLETIVTPQITYIFTGWNVSDDEVITEDLEVTASYMESATQYTVTFYDEDGTTVLGTSTVGYGTNASYNGSIPTKEKTQEFTYTFSGWDEEAKLENVTEDRSVVATYTETKNTYTVTFQDWDGTKLYEVTVPYGTIATYEGATPTRSNWTFTGWDKDFSNVVDHMTVTAQYDANLVSIKAARKDNNTYLKFQVNTDANIKEYITVTKVYADGHTEKALDHEYTTDFTTKRVGEDIVLNVELTGTNLKDASLTYKITEEPAYQTMFEVHYNPNKTYRQTKSGVCSTAFGRNCDSLENTTEESKPYSFIEVIERYDQNITVDKVEATYVGQTTPETLYVDNNIVRWSSTSLFGVKPTIDPVRLVSRGTESNPLDVMNDDLVMDTVTITYTRSGYGTHQIVFRYNQETNTFKAISGTDVD